MMMRQKLTLLFALCAIPAWSLSQDTSPPTSPSPGPFPSMTPAVVRPPVLATVATLQDWAVACDNSLTCEATNLQPEDGGDGGTMLSVNFSISPPPAPSATMEVSVDRNLAKGAYRLMVTDSNVVAHEFPNVDAMVGPFTLDAKGMKALSTGTQLLLEDSGGLDIAKISLAGFRDVLLKAQAAQKGKADVRTISRLPLANVPKSPPMEPTPKEVMSLRKSSDCSVAKGEWQDKIIAPLDRTTTLILLSCGAGAYNYSYVPYIGRIERGKRSFTFAPFDLAPDWGDDGAVQPTLVNPSWNGPEGKLSSYGKGRGIGDCGSAQDWVWTGGQFTLVEAHAMPECRGSLFWPTVFRADVRPPYVAAVPVVIPKN